MSKKYTKFADVGTEPAFENMCQTCCFSLKISSFLTILLIGIVKKPTDFTRKRKLPIQTLIAFLLSLVRSSYQNEAGPVFQHP